MTEKIKNRIIEDKDGVLKVDVSTYKNPKQVLTINRADWKKLVKASNGGKWSAQRMTSKGAYNHPLVAGAYCKGKKIYAHRILMSEGKIVVFLNGNRLDLRRENLKYGTSSDCRTGKPHRDSTTGERGVSKAGNKYRLDLNINKGRYYFGLFETVSDAAHARDEIEKEIKGMPVKQTAAFLADLTSKEV